MYVKGKEKLTSAGDGLEHSVRVCSVLVYPVLSPGACAKVTANNQHSELLSPPEKKKTTHKTKLQRNPQVLLEQVLAGFSCQEMAHKALC